MWSRRRVMQWVAFCTCNLRSVANRRAANYNSPSDTIYTPQLFLQLPPLSIGRAGVITCAKFQDELWNSPRLQFYRRSNCLFPIDFYMGLITVHRQCAACAYALGTGAWNWRRYRRKYSVFRWKLYNSLTVRRAVPMLEAEMEPGRQYWPETRPDPGLTDPWPASTRPKMLTRRPGDPWPGRPGSISGWRFLVVSRQRRVWWAIFLQRTTRAWDIYLPNFMEIDQAVFPSDQVEETCRQNRSLCT